MGVASERRWLFQIVVEPRSDFIQFVGVSARYLLPFQRAACRLEDSLFNMAVFIFVTDDEADVFALFERVVTLEDETLVFGLDEGETARDAGEDCAHASADDLVGGGAQPAVSLCECGVLTDGDDDRRAVA